MSHSQVIGTTAAAEEPKSQDPLAASLHTVMDFLSNTAPDKVEAAANRLVAQDATYVSLNFSNPELKKIMPWTGTDKGPRAYSGTFLGVANYWKIDDFTVTDKFASGEDVAVFGKFTYPLSRSGPCHHLTLLDPCKGSRWQDRLLPIYGRHLRYREFFPSNGLLGCESDHGRQAGQSRR